MVATDWLAKKMYDLGYIQKLDKDGARARVLAPQPRPRPRRDPTPTMTSRFPGRAG